MNHPRRSAGSEQARGRDELGTGPPDHGGKGDQGDQGDQGDSRCGVGDGGRRIFGALIVANFMGWIAAIAGTHGFAGRQFAMHWVVTLVVAGGSSAWLMAGRGLRPHAQLPVWTWLGYVALVTIACRGYIVARGAIALVELGIPTLGPLIVLAGVWAAPAKARAIRPFHTRRMWRRPGIRRRSS